MGMWCWLKRLSFAGPDAGKARSRMRVLQHANSPAPAGPAATGRDDTRHSLIVGAATYGAATATGTFDALSSERLSGAAMSGAIAAYQAHPPEQRTPEKARELGVQMGMWDAINGPPSSGPPPVM